MMCARARFIFSDISLSMKACSLSLALCSACRLYGMTLFEGVAVRADAELFVKDGSFGFVPIANW